MTLVVFAFMTAMAALAVPTFALTANAIKLRYALDRARTWPVAAAVHIFNGAWVGKDPAGNAKPFEPGDELVGQAAEEADNSSGAAGAITVKIECQGDFVQTISGIGWDDVNRPAFATDDDSAALTGHPDAYIGNVIGVEDTDKAIIRFKRPGELPPNGLGSITLGLTGHETFAATGAVAGSAFVNGFQLKSILGPGFVVNDEEDGGIEVELDGTDEQAISSVRTPHDILPIDKGLTFDVDLVVTAIGDAAGATHLDLDFGFGTGLTGNSELDISHADMVQLFAFHLDGFSEVISLQSDDDTTDVAAVDTTIVNDSTTDVPKHFKGIVRPDGTCEGWINGARVLSGTAFAMLSTALVAFFINLEKDSDDSVYRAVFKNLLVKGGAAA